MAYPFHLISYHTCKILVRPTQKIFHSIINFKYFKILQGHFIELFTF